MWGANFHLDGGVVPVMIPNISFAYIYVHTV